MSSILDKQLGHVIYFAEVNPPPHRNPDAVGGGGKSPENQQKKTEIGGISAADQWKSKQKKEDPSQKWAQDIADRLTRWAVGPDGKGGYMVKITSALLSALETPLSMIKTNPNVLALKIMSEQVNARLLGAMEKTAEKMNKVSKKITGSEEGGISAADNATPTDNETEI